MDRQPNTRFWLLLGSCAWRKATRYDVCMYMQIQLPCLFLAPFSSFIDLDASFSGRRFRDRRPDTSAYCYIYSDTCMLCHSATVYIVGEGCTATASLYVCASPPAFQVGLERCCRAQFYWFAREKTEGRRLRYDDLGSSTFD